MYNSAFDGGDQTEGETGVPGSTHAIISQPDAAWSSHI